MTITEAARLQTIAAYLRGEILDPGKVADALAFLETRAHMTVHAGQQDDAVTWHERLVGRGWYSL